MTLNQKRSPVRDIRGAAGRPAAIVEGISPHVANVLYADLKAMADALGAFRYEGFAKRIVAAEYGRPDAVEWANEWYCEVVEGMRAEMDAHFAAIDKRNVEQNRLRAEFEAGRVTNRRYQSYLDTIEDPKSISNHSGYFAWMSERSAEYAKAFPQNVIDGLSDPVTHFDTFLREYAETHLSERVRRQRNI